MDFLANLGQFPVGQKVLFVEMVESTDLALHYPCSLPHVYLEQFECALAVVTFVYPSFSVQRRITLTLLCLFAVK